MGLQIGPQTGVRILLDAGRPVLGEILRRLRVVMFQSFLIVTDVI